MESTPVACISSCARDAVLEDLAAHRQRGTLQYPSVDDLAGAAAPVLGCICWCPGPQGDVESGVFEEVVHFSGNLFVEEEEG